MTALGPSCNSATVAGGGPTRYFRRVSSKSKAIGLAGAQRPPRPATQLTDALRAAGLRRTTPRIAVLQRLEAAVGPVSHAEIAKKLAVSGYDRATVYRNLIDLVDAGLVTRTDLGDHVWRFELVRHGGKPHAAHPHFLCTDCGDVSCLPGGAVKIVRAQGVPRAIGDHNVEVQVKGRCDACG